MARAPRSWIQLALPVVLAATALVALLLVVRDDAALPAPGASPRASSPSPAPHPVVIERGPPPSPRGPVPVGIEAPASAAAARSVVPVVQVDSAAPLVVRVHVCESASLTRPVADVAVELAFVAPTAPLDGPPLLVARADARGIAECVIAWSAIEAARADPRGLALCARIDAIGWQRSSAVVELPASHRVREIALAVQRGATLHGRLVDASGRGVPGRVTLRPATEAEPGGVNPATASDDGSFSIGVRNGGLYDVSADAGEHGTAALLRHEIVLGTEPLPSITLVASGPGRLHGRVVGASGRGAAGVVLSFGLDAPDTNERAFENSPRGGGRSRVQLTTTDDGSFDARGLHFERYRIGLLPRGSWGPVTDLVPGGVLADGTPLVLHHARPHLVVRVVDERGEALTKDALQGLGLREAPRLAVEPIDPVDAPRVVETPDGLRVFEVEPGRAYRVTLAGADVTTVARRVAVAPGAERIDVEMALVRRATGWLAVEIVDAEQRARADRLRVIVEDAASHAIVASAQLEHASVTNPLALPEGRLRVIVDGFARSGDGFHALDVELGGRFEVEVDLVRDATTMVRATFPEGARVRLRIVGVATEHEARPTRSTEVLLPGDVRAVFFDLDPDAALGRGPLTAHLLDGERAPLHVEFRLVEPEDTASGVAEPAVWTSGLLPSGDFVLFARLADGRTARAPVVLVDGATTDVLLTFD